MAAAIRAACHCGKITVTAPRKPDHINVCQCKVCFRYGAEWGYYEIDEVTISPPDPKTKTYIWGEKKIAFHSCDNCCGVMYWWPINGTSGMGLNTKMVDADQLYRVEKRMTWMPDD